MKIYDANACGSERARIAPTVDNFVVCEERLNRARGKRENLMGREKKKKKMAKSGER